MSLHLDFCLFRNCCLPASDVPLREVVENVLPTITTNINRISREKL